jgi:hypothetical protein
MKTFIRTSIALGIAFHAASILPAAAASPDILTALREKACQAYARYEGVESVREINTCQFDSLTGKALGSYQVTLQRREYYYKKATYKVLRYIEDGREMPPAKYKYKTRDPLIPPLDRNSEENYILKVNGSREISGRKCHEVDVVPKKKTARHISGRLYFTEDTLDLLYFEGTTASYPFGLKSLSIQIFFSRLDDSWVMRSGTYTFTIHVPLLYPHRKFVTSFTSREDRLIPAAP